MWFMFGFFILSLLMWVFAIRAWPHHVTWKEAGLFLLIQTLVIGTVYYGSMYGKGYDKQILNGQVTNKYHERVSCSHSYPCRCRTVTSGSGKNRTTSTVCDTCYLHAYDVDWIVQSDVGGNYIDRIDSQGTSEPPRWTAVQIGEPYSKESSYYNYIKASPLSIFNKSSLNEQVEIPDYLHVHDYYRINRVIDYKSKFSHDGELNRLLNEKMKLLGPVKKVNLVVVLHSLGETYAEKLKTKELGGKINDVFVVIDMAPDGQFNSVAVFSWSKDDIVNVRIRDALLDVGKYDAQAMTTAITENIKTSYQARSIKEFEYLDNEVELPDWAVIFILAFGLIFPFASCYVARNHMDL